MEEAKVQLIPVDDIIPNRFQPRLKFSEKELQGLAESISEHGIVSPIIVRKIGDKFEIIAGERRFKAANLVGLTTVPCIVKELDDTESAEIAVIENLQRSNLTPIEEARSYEKLLSKGMTQEELAKRLGVSQPTIANKVRLLNLTPEVQDALLHNKISERHARSLLQISNPDMQNNLLNTIITNRLTVRQTDNEVSALLNKNLSAAGSEDIFNVNIDEIKENSEDIFKTQEHIDFESLLKKESTPEVVQEERVLKMEPPKVEDDNEEESGEIKVPDVINISEPSPVVTATPSVQTPTNEEEWINPFQVINGVFEDPLPKETPVQVVESPVVEQKVVTPPVDPDLDSLNSYLSGSTIKIQTEEKPKQSTASVKRISNVINATRNMKVDLEMQGIQIDTEEFDFDDMYQIVIKVKKD